VYKRQEQVEWQSEVDELYLDADHFRLVLDNLLSNALLNRSDAESTVAIHLKADSEHWKLEVCNQGNIELDVREKLFEPFVSGRSAGIGLGLATVQQVCMVNGWQVEVTTEAGWVYFTIRGLIKQPEMMGLNENVSGQVSVVEAGHG
jgi:signal transduction histidine kinase